MIRYAAAFLASQTAALFERHPSLGYLSATVTTSAGFWSLVDAATKLGALLSVLVGLLVGVTTYRVQRATLARQQAKDAAKE